MQPFALADALIGAGNRWNIQCFYVAIEWFLGRTESYFQLQCSWEICIWPVSKTHIHTHASAGRWRSSKHGMVNNKIYSLCGARERERGRGEKEPKRTDERRHIRFVFNVSNPPEWLYRNGALSIWKVAKCRFNLLSISRALDELETGKSGFLIEHFHWKAKWNFDLHTPKWIMPKRKEEIKKNKNKSRPYRLMEIDWRTSKGCYSRAKRSTNFANLPSFK